MNQAGDRGRPRLLDLFCGAGGCTKGYQEAGFEVVGVDIKPQPNYCGDEFIQADAIEWLDGALEGGMLELGGFVAVHASPPCQAYTHARHIANRGRDDHPRLIEPVREILRQTGLPYVIENVVGAPLENLIELCGPSFGLDVKRHRLFETSFAILAPACACGPHREPKFPSTPRVEVGYRDDEGKRPLSRYVNPLASGTTHELFAEAMGIDWIPARGKRPAKPLQEAIPPAYTRHVGSYLLQHLATNERAAA